MCKRIVILALALTACTSGATTGVSAPCRAVTFPADQTARTSITQGVSGNVREWVGFMGIPACGSISAISATILVYPPTPGPRFGTSEWVSHWRTFPAPPIDSVRSDSTGFVQIALPSGEYSLVVRDTAGYYIELPTFRAFTIGYVRVDSGKVVRFPFDITWRASF